LLRQVILQHKELVEQLFISGSPVDGIFKLKLELKLKLSTANRQ
jgi:hypothetical protein